MNEAELKLVCRAQDGDRAAFGELVERFKGRVYAMSMAITGDGDLAQELAQETFVRALQNLPRLEQPERFASWLRGIANTIHKDLRRKTARERGHIKTAAYGRVLLADAPESALADQENAEMEKALLAEQIAALPENCRVALDLRFREELSYAGIAEAMGVPVSTVRGLLYRGTKVLRQKLQPVLRKTRGTSE